jgi:hypothetical protein
MMFPPRHLLLQMFCSEMKEEVPNNESWEKRMDDWSDGSDILAASSFRLFRS